MKPGGKSGTCLETLTLNHCTKHRWVRFPFPPIAESVPTKYSFIQDSDGLNGGTDSVNFSLRSFAPLRLKRFYRKGRKVRNGDAKSIFTAFAFCNRWQGITVKRKTLLPMICHNRQEGSNEKKLGSELASFRIAI